MASASEIRCSGCGKLLARTLVPVLAQSLCVVCSRPNYRFPATIRIES